VRPREQALAAEFENRLQAFDRNSRRLPGLRTTASRQSFVEQLVESVRRVRYVSVIRTRDVSPACADPVSNLFNPVKAAILRLREGRHDEAFWFVFLFVHFGRHRIDKWRLVRDIYGRFGAGPAWDWSRTSANPEAFRDWLAEAQARLSSDGVSRRFGNHRKYQSLNAEGPNSTGEAFVTYVRWVDPARGHVRMVEQVLDSVGGDPAAAFDSLYSSMSDVASFGRTARFDYLTMLGKIGLALIEPGSVYMDGATGPWKGASLLFYGTDNAPVSRAQVDSFVRKLAGCLNVGMQVMEDALCNWQKSPEVFRPFRG
jgi:hypothetical protein